MFDDEGEASLFSRFPFSSADAAHFYIEYAEYRLALIHSPTWGRHPERLQAAKRAFNRSFFFNVGLGVLLYIGSSALISGLTWEMDRRASDIATGLSRMFAGWIFMLLSVNLPQWMGCYFSVVDTYKTRLAMFRTTREIRFSFSWTLWRHLVSLACESCCVSFLKRW